jgi:cobalt/nickel transport system permease protein
MRSFFRSINPPRKRSFLSELDPRAKLLGILTFVVLVLITPHQKYLNFGVFTGIVFAMAAFSRLSWKEVARGVIFLSPLLAFLTLSVFLTPEKEPGHHLIVLWNILIKFLLSFLALTVLRLTTDFSDLVKALEKIKVPHLFTSILFLSLRSVFLLGEEAERMKRAMESRSFGKIKKGKKTRILFSLMFHLFDRAFSRSQKVLAAMLSRGFDGRIRTICDFRLKAADFLFLAFFIALLVMSVVS